MGLWWLGAAGIAVVGGVLLVMSFVPDDAMVAIPIPAGAARRRLRPVGLVLLLLGLMLPPVGYSVQQIGRAHV
jgi:hypothetical protein